jgi:uncharacterized repeat protein (TIGR01451 family)
MSHASRRWLPRLSNSTGGDIAPRRARIRDRRRSRPELEPLESRRVLSVTIAPTNDGGNGYAALDFNQSGGYVPPDTCGAAGPTSYVETVNQTVALYGSKATGTPATTAGLDNFWFSTGGLAHADGGSFRSDPIVVYDDQIGRFIVGDQDVDYNTHVSTFDLAVSTSSNPATLTKADWNFFQYNTTESGYDADYPGNFGYNADALVITLNMFGASDHVQVVSISNSALTSQPPTPLSPLNSFRNDLNDFSVRPTAMHDGASGEPMWLVTEHGDGTSIDVIKMTNVLSTGGAAFTYTNLAVAPYGGVVNPLNPNGTVITNNIDSRIMKAAEANDTLVAAHSVSVSSTQDDAQWYAVDLSGATPTLAQQGRVSAGNHTYITYPAVDINQSGQIGMTYMKSGTDAGNDYMSMYVTGWSPGDASGTMETPVLVPAGAGQANYRDFSGGGRAGDLSGINVDPIDGSFWGASEFANTEGTANWGTAVANFTLTPPLPPADAAVTVSGPSSVNAGATATYTITVTNKGPNIAQGLVLTDILPSGSTFVSMTQSSGSDTFTQSPPTPVTTVTETAVGTIDVNSSDTFTLVVTAPASLGNGANFSDNASVSTTSADPVPSNNTSTQTGSILNTNASADLSVKITGSSSSTEGNSVTYTITVSNAGSSSATGVSLTDTFGSILNYKSVSLSQGVTSSVAANVVTFTIGTIASGGSVTEKVTVQAMEDGSTSNAVAVTGTTADPNLANNTGSATTNFTEASINVSGSVTARSQVENNVQVATFSHASGVEPASAFSATINWGDGVTTAGTITQVGNNYVVTGSHTYSRTGRYSVRTTVIEVGGASAVNDGAGKLDVNPATLAPINRDIVQISAVQVDDTGPTGKGKGKASSASKGGVTLVGVGGK